jgi:hypothetical protein
VAIESG